MQTEILTESGPSVYDEFELELGDNLRQSIDRGLAETHYGVVILSENFFGKEWTERELDGLTSRNMGDDKVLLPLWYGVDKETVQSYSPPLANIYAEEIHENNITEVAETIYHIIYKSEN